MDRFHSMDDRAFNLRNFAISLAICAMCSGIGIATRAHAQEIAEPHTAAAVIADDEGWSKAEQSGDVKYVDALLLPEYRSTSSDGSTHDKSAILAHTAKSGQSGEAAAKVAQWQAAHPYRTSVAITGDTAILTFIRDKGADPGPIMSCDVFVYQGGHWHALYSQHTEAEK